MVAQVLARSVSEALTLVDDAVAAIAAGRGGNAEVATIVSNLVTIWGLVERDPGVQAAATDVFEAANAVLNTREFRLQRLLRDALRRLHDRVGAARISPQAVCPRELAA